MADIAIITLSMRAHHALAEHLRAKTTLEIHELATAATANPEQVFGKRQYIMESALALFRRRHILEVLRSTDAVLVVTHAIIPVLVHRRLTRSRGRSRVVSYNLFFHNRPLMRIYAALLRPFITNDVVFIVNAETDAAVLVEYFGVEETNLRAVTFTPPRSLIAPDTSRGRYVFAGGYSNRDFTTVIEAARGEDFKLVICAKPGMRIPEDVPPNVEIVFNESSQEFSAILAGATVGVVALFAGRGGGHSVLLEHYQRAQPTVITDDPVFDGYDSPDATIRVPAGDVLGMRQAMATLMHDEAMATRMGLAGLTRYESDFNPATSYEQIAEAMTS